MAYEDLLKDTSASFEDGNYFVVTITDLTPGIVYPLEFRWKYKDGTFAEWGCVKTIISPIQSTPKRPFFSQSDLSYFQGILTVTWSGKDFTNNSYGAVFDRIDVYVASDASPGVFTVRGSIKVPGGKLEIPVEPGTYYVKLKTIFKPDSQSIFSDNTYSITAKADAPSIPLAVSSSWSGTDFNVSFTHDASATSNKYFSYYRITLTGGGVTRTFNLAPVTGSSQLFALSLAKNRAAFGVPQTTFSGSVASIDVYGNSSSEVSFPSTSYVNSLPAPIISATEIQQGYSISYTTPTSATYDHIEIEEVESNAATAPTTGYSVIFSGVANPAPIIRPNQNKRWVRARFADNIGSFSAYSSAIAATPLSPVTVDNVPPSAPASGTVTAGIDNSTGATVGFNAYLNISWNAVSDSTLRGYRIRFRENGTTNPYSYVDSPGTGTTFRLNGLSIGTTYEVGVASYDEYNNTSSAYTSVGTATATGTPFIGKNVTTVGYFGASATGDTGTFKFGYGVQDSGGTKRGLVFNSNNYWYIDSAQSALFKLGGDTNNYIEWNGSTFVVQGDIRAKAGNFSGNVQIQSGGSLYSGTLTQAGALSGAGFILNNSGLTFNSSSVNGITTINGTTGLFTTSSANIGGWNVTSSSIAKTSTSGTITLNSSNAQITLSSTSYNAGIATPDTNSPTDIVFWAGGGRSTAASFYVRADGTVKMSSAVITGYATSDSLTATNNTVATKVSNSQVKDHIGGTNVSTISGGVITTGIVKSSNFPGANSQAADGSGFSTNGTALNLDNGTITSPKFRINTSGSAFFTGTVVAEAFTLSNTGGDYWSVTPGSTSSGFRFGGSTGIQYSGSGKITLGTNTEIYGDLLLNTYNYWKPSNNTFNVGDSTKFINWNGSSLTVTGNISGSTISGGSINITGESFSYNSPDSDSGASGDISSQSNAFTSNYPRTPLGYSSPITTVGFNAVALISTTTAGVVSSWYPYYDASADLGVKYSPTYGTAPYRWRNLRLTGIAYFGGDGYSNTLSSSTPTSTDIKIAINSSGTIYANLLGTGTGGTIVQNSNGFLKVQSSSRKYKENIISISGNYLNSILQLNPVNFNYKEEFSGTSENPTISGLIAEEVAEIAQLSGIINYNNEGEPESVSYERLTVFLAKAIKELSERLDVLEG